MTRELRTFAKNRIEYLIKISPFVFDEPDREALETAIQALSQESCEECKYKTFTEFYFHTDPEMVEQEPSNTVSREVFEQVMCERDIAIEQLHELGYELGQKIEPCEVEAAKLQQTYNKGFEACRQAVLDYIDKMPSELTADGRRMIRRRTLEEYISDTLPSVTPTCEEKRKELLEGEE